jgi:ferredoxin
MCDFCTQHGEGRTWYLNAKNYSADLLSDLKRKHFIENFLNDVITKNNRTFSLLEKSLLLQKNIPRVIREKITRHMKAEHFGQVLPIEEVEKVLALSRTVTRVACGCKWAKEKKEIRTCYSVSLEDPAWYDFMNMDFFGSPEVARLENLSTAQALADIRRTDDQGMVHSIWTFNTPFIGAICNCDKQYCLSLRSTVGLDIPVMFRAEYVAAVDESACQGCRACADKCQFNAISYDDSRRVSLIDLNKCYGCGVCRPACPTAAISLHDRRADPIAAAIW